MRVRNIGLAQYRLPLQTPDSSVQIALALVLYTNHTSCERAQRASYLVALFNPRRACAARVTVVVLRAQRRSKFSKIWNIGNTLTLSLAFDQLRKHTPLEQMLQGVSSTLKVRVLLLASLHSERLADPSLLHFYNTR